MIRAVDQAHDELATGSRPCFVGLPDVAVGLGAGVVLQAAVARRHCLLNRVAAATATAAATTHVLRNGVAAGEDVQAKVATQAELDRDGLPGVDRVDRGQVVHWLEEAGPVVGHL